MRNILGLEENIWGLTKSNDDTVYLGEIKTVATFGVFVVYNEDCEGLVLHSKIPGCKENKENLPKVCKVGDKMRVTISMIDYKDNRITLDCVEFPVENDPDNG